MHRFKLFYLTTLILFSSYICYARKNKTVDSLDVRTKEHIIVFEHSVGGHDYHEFGKLTIEQHGSKYCITFPFFLNIDTTWYAKPDDEIIPEGTMINIKLENGEIVQSKTRKDVKPIWHFLWRYNVVRATRNGTEVVGQGNRRYLTVYKWKDNKNQPTPSDDFENIYGINWLVKFEFTSSDMLRISKHKIIAVWSMKNSKKIIVPIKRNQSKRIRKSVFYLLHRKI